MGSAGVSGWLTAAADPGVAGALGSSSNIHSESFAPLTPARVAAPASGAGQEYPGPEIPELANPASAAGWLGHEYPGPG